MAETPRIRSCVACPACRFKRYRFESARQVQATPEMRECQVCGEPHMQVFDMERGGALCVEHAVIVPDVEHAPLTAAEEAMAARLLGQVFP